MPGGDSFSKFLFSARGSHQHHQIVHPVFTPATQPAHAPVAKPGAQRHRGTKAKVFGFHLHVISCHSCGPHIHASSCAEWQVRCAGARVSCARGTTSRYFTIFAMAFLAAPFHSTSGAAG